MNHKKLPACLCLIPFCFTISLLFTFSGTSAQPGTSHPVLGIRDTLPPEDNFPIIYEEVEIEASFPGGQGAWFKYLEKNLNANTPVVNGAPAGTYTVIVQFVVATDGFISQVKPLTKHGYGMEAEVIRLLRKSPKWEPAIQNGRKVFAYRKQPVTFEIVEEKRKKKKGS